MVTFWRKNPKEKKKKEKKEKRKKRRKKKNKTKVSAAIYLFLFLFSKNLPIGSDKPESRAQPSARHRLPVA